MMDKKRWITAERWLSGVLWFVRPRVKATNLEEPPYNPHSDKSPVILPFRG
jgi:hypothetical protein